MDISLNHVVMAPFLQFTSDLKFPIDIGKNDHLFDFLTVCVDGILLSYLYEEGPSVYFLKCPSCLGLRQMLLSNQESDSSYIGTSNSEIS